MPINSDSESSLVIFDLDGTLANVKHRLNLLAPPSPDYSSFDAACIFDEPIASTVAIAKAFHSSGFQIWILTGRSQNYESQTRGWLHKYQIPYDKLLMRPNGDRQPDYKLKKDWALKYALTKRAICALEDRDQVIQMWQELGVSSLKLVD